MAQIIWTESALADLERIAEYIALDKPLAARLLVQTVFKKVELLKRFPRLGTIPPELKGMSYRQIVIPPCRIFYRSYSGKIFIVSVMRGEKKFQRQHLERHLS